MSSGRAGEQATPAAAAGAWRLLGRGYQGAVYLRERNGKTVIVKVPIGRGPARAARRAMLRREYRVYQRLAGIPGVPRCEGLAQGEQLLLEYVEGPSLREVELTGAARERFFDELLRLIRAMHAAGVAHGDLKRKDNILVGPDGTPYLIDFGTALTIEQRASAPRRWLFRQLRRIDINAWVKLKYQRHMPAMNVADALLYRPTLPERIARPLRRAWRTVTMRRTRKSRRQAP